MDDTKDKKEEKRALEDFTDIKFGGLKSETQEKGQSWKKDKNKKGKNSREEKKVKEKKKRRRKRRKERS